MGATPQASTISLDGFLIGGIMLLLITALFVSVRLWVGLSRSKKLFVDDYLSILATVFVTGAFVINYLSTSELASYTPSVSHLSQLAYASNFVGSYSLFLAKTPILFLYIRLFGVKIWVKVASYLVLAITFIVVLVGSTYCAVVCRPMYYTKNCITSLTTKGTYVGAIAVAADVAILIIPLPILLRLNVSPKKRIGISIVFLTGIFGIATAAAALAFKYRSGKGDSTTRSFALLSSAIECCVAIMVGCAPATASFWTRIVTQTILYQSIRSRISQISLLWTHGNSSSQTRGPQAPHDQPYIELAEGFHKSFDQSSVPESGKTFRPPQNHTRLQAA